MKCDISTENLTSLLWTLPFELRLHIYELSLPCMFHRKRKIVLDYITDSAWMATSPAIFAEAAPLVFRKPLLFIYTALDSGERLINSFDGVLERTFGRDFFWVRDEACSMVERIAVTIRFPRFYMRLSNLKGRLPHYFSDLATFTALKELQISLGPDCLPDSLEMFEKYVSMTDMAQNISDTAVLADSPFLSRLKDAADAMRGVIPSTCKVNWRFDKAGMPCVLSYVTDRSKVIHHLEGVNNLMGRFWKDEARTEEQLQR